MPLQFEDQLSSLAHRIDRLPEKIGDLQGRGTTIHEMRDGVFCDVTAESRKEFFLYLDLASAEFERLPAEYRNSGGERAG